MTNFRSQLSVVLFLVLVVWSMLLGWGMAVGLNAAAKSENITQGMSVAIATVDPVPARYQQGLQLYLENCASCHVPLPPEVMPSDTWRTLLLEPEEHYGRQLEPITRPFIFLVWDYLQAFSRPLAKDEKTPLRLTQSRYFQALHPQVTLPPPLNVSSCVSCHPGAADYDYRRLTPEWEN